MITFTSYVDKFVCRIAMAALLGVGVALALGPFLGIGSASVLYAVLFGAKHPTTISKEKRKLKLIEKEVR